MLSSYEDINNIKLPGHFELNIRFISNAYIKSLFINFCTHFFC